MTITPTPANQPARTEAINGLRQLADFLDAHPDVPVADHSWTLHAFPRDAEDDATEQAEVDHVAVILGVTVRDDTANGGHYLAARTFGRVTYEFVHIPDHTRAAHHERVTGTADSASLNDTPEAA